MKTHDFLAHKLDLDHDDDHDPGANISVVVGGAPVADILGTDNFPCIDEEDEEEFQKQTVAFARELVRRWNAHNALVDALKRIVAWEIPETGQTWKDGTPMSYAACYGSNGERDHIKAVAQAALSAVE